jgi:hypothetical protein
MSRTRRAAAMAIFVTIIVSVSSAAFACTPFHANTSFYACSPFSDHWSYGADFRSDARGDGRIVPPVAASDPDTTIMMTLGVRVRGGDF